MEDEKYSLALEMIDQELAMPYVPEDVLVQLNDLRTDCKSHMEQPVKSFDLDTYIHGSAQQQEKAVALLKTMNLRLLKDEIQILLDSSDLVDEIKGELIESLMEQKIDTPFKIKKQGYDITFIPSMILNQNEDEVLVQVRAIFEEWFSNDNPTFYQFCLRLIEQEALENRPFDFSEMDPYSIAKSIVRLVSEAFGQSEEFKAFVQMHQLEDVMEQPLAIERRGENDEK